MLFVSPTAVAKMSLKHLVIFIFVSVLHVSYAQSDEPKLPPLATCISNNVCQDTASCEEGLCQCKPGYAISQNLLLCKATKFSTEISGCKSTDFDDGDGCTLTFTVNATYNTTYNLKSHSWGYVTRRGPSNFDGIMSLVTLFDGELDADPTSNMYTMSYNLTKYYSGFYISNMVLVNSAGETEDISAAFRISRLPGIALTLPCQETSQCDAFNANCSSVIEGDVKTCNCNGINSIPYYPGYEIVSPACFANKTENGACNVDDECYQTNQSYACKNNLCTCTGGHAFVDELHKDMCLKKEPLNGKCYYTEQCQLVDQNTYCKDRTECACADGYELNDTHDSCIATFSGGAIAGIVIGSVAGAVVLVSFIVYLLK